MSTNKTLSSSQMLNMASIVIQSHRSAAVWDQVNRRNRGRKGYAALLQRQLAPFSRRVPEIVSITPRPPSSIPANIGYDNDRRLWTRLALDLWIARER